jgi:ubiquinone/menaquinone biosynthesis C-methylase UbiE
MSKKPILIDGLDYWTAFGERLTELMNFKRSTKVLDIGTGSGACLIPAAMKIGLQGQIIGIDLWPNKIEATLENIRKKSLTNASAEVMDARKLTFNDNFFDYSICGFIGFSGFFDFQNNKYRTNNAIMEEIFRVLKPNGIAGFSTWLLQEDLECLRFLIQEYLSEYTSATQAEIKAVPTSYSKESIEGFKIILSDAGFKDLKVFSEDFILKYETTEEWFEMMKRVGWILKQTIGSTEKKINDFKNKMLPMGLEKYKKENGYYFTKKVIFAFGIK